ncbi:MAG: acyl CoA:acetate/3-ketoacid CoA transferase, partial [Clostridiales bacterium]|nr:acyl CoA:acetate/3-ketoacid CoA transferase [Clostridiales bacterium]
MSVQDAVAMVKDGDTVATCMAGNIGNARWLIKHLEDRFLETGSPKGLTKVSGCGHIGDAHFAHPGYVTKFIGAHPGPCRPMLTMINNCETEGYGMPQGVMQQLFRATAAKQPGIFTKIGQRTYVDPRLEGGRYNAISKDTLSEIVTIDGEDWIFYKAIPIDVALLRGGIADEFGNICIDSEAIKMEILEIALAVRACNGKVIFQVKNVVAGGSIKPKDVCVPAELVDAVVVAEDFPTYHLQTNVTLHNPFFSGELKAPKSAAPKPPEVLDPREVLCRRAVYELSDGKIINVGLGVGVGVCNVAAYEDMTDRVTFTLEMGAFGGTPVPMPDFGAVLNPVSYISHPSMFDFYHAGGLDIAFVGVAEIDKEGSVNVSRYGELTCGRGQGGFIDITQCAKKVVFCTYFRAGGLKATIADGKLTIDEEGRETKFVDAVNQYTFSGPLAMENGQEIVFVTERAVFKLEKEGITLTEIAPGIDLEKDILSKMEFKPIVSKD